MSILIIGLVLFVGMHLIPRVRPLRTALVDGLGANRYRAIYSIISAVSLVLIVWGFARAPIEPVFQPPSWGRTATMTVLPVVFILFAAANMPTHIRAFVRHPMLIGLLLWGSPISRLGDLIGLAVWIVGCVCCSCTHSRVASGARDGTCRKTKATCSDGCDCCRCGTRSYRRACLLSRCAVRNADRVAQTSFRIYSIL